MSRGFQAKHIPEKALIDLVDRLYNVPRIHGLAYGETIMDYSSSASFEMICKVWDNIPPKVILVKLRKLEEAGKLSSSGPSGMHFRVVHLTDLPVYRYFNPVTEQWVDVPMSHKDYKNWERAKGDRML